MKLKIKNKLNTKIWKYFLIFSVIIIVFLWFFQIIFLNRFYENSKLKELENNVETIKKVYDSGEDITSTLDSISLSGNVCIDVTNGNNQTIYMSDQNRECLKNKDKDFYKFAFLNSGETSKGYITTNPVFENKSIMYCLKLSDNVFLYINTSLVLISPIINVLKTQLIYVTIIVLALSLLIAYFMSKRLATPIEKINNNLPKLAKGEFDVYFPSSDIKEIDNLSITLNAVTKELSQTDELRKELMANVSHDLKTPLTMIKAYAEMVRDLTYKDDKKREDNLNVIISESDRLNNLVNDILTLSKLESNIIPLEKEEFNLNEIIKDILNRYKIYENLEEYKITFKSDKDYIIKADKKRIEQVLYNLINNAIEHTDNKKVLVSINDSKVEVINHGEEIKTKDINLIFNRYYRSNKKYKRNVVGTGLGLSIVKNILELHNFEYGVSSIKKITKFYFIVK